MTTTEDSRLAEPNAEEQAELEQLYRDFEAAHMTPLGPSAAA